MVIQLDYSFLEDVASHFVKDDENTQQSDEEIVLAALDSIADEKLTSLALRLVLSERLAIPREGQPDFLKEAEQVFATKKPEVEKAKAKGSRKTPQTAKASLKKDVAEAA